MYSVGTPCAVGLAAESTYGTPVAATRWVACSPGSEINHEFQYEETENCDSSIAGVPCQVDQTGNYVAATLHIVATYVGLGILFESLFGATPTKSGAQYIYAMGVGGTKSFTLTTHSSDGTRRVYSGMVCASAVLDMDAAGSGAFGVWTFELIGSRKTAETTGNSYPTLQANLSQIVRADDFLSFLFVATTYPGVTDFSISLERNVKPVFTFGNLHPTGVSVDGYPQCRIDCMLASKSRFWQNAHNAETTGSVVVTLQLSASYRYVFTMYKSSLSEYSDGVGSALGYTAERAAFVGSKDPASATSESFRFVVNNLASTYDA